MAKMRTGAFARAVGFSERVARLYADEGLIPSERDSSGSRLFDLSTVETARKLYQQRTARNGQRAA